LRIFPLSVRGNSSTSTTSRGTMKFSSFERAKRRISSSVNTEPGSSNDVGSKRLTETVVGDAHDRRLQNAAKAVEHVLDFDRAHLLPTSLDDVVGATDEVEETVFVDREVIVGAEHGPARIRPVRQPALRQHRVAPVAHHQVRAPDVEDAGFARGHRSARFVEHQRRWDVLQAGWPLWRPGMRYGQRRGTPGVTA
jgi:hypothetical protein